MKILKIKEKKGFLNLGRNYLSSKNFSVQIEKHVQFFSFLKMVLGCVHLNERSGIE